MSYINQTKVVTPPTAHANFMAGISYDITNPIVRLKTAASSCFFGEPQYYLRDSSDKRPARERSSRHLSTPMVEYLSNTLESIFPVGEWVGKSPAVAMEAAIDAALDHDIEQTLMLAASLRQQDNIRTTPQVIMVRAANHPKSKKTGLVRKYAGEIIRRGDEPAVQLAYQLSTYGKKVPNSLKKSWKTALERLTEYQLAKYKMETRLVKTIDVVRFAHANSVWIDKLVRDELTLNQSTWESLISEKGSNTETWTEAIGLMGHMALLRNLRNLTKNEVDPSLYLDKLVEGVEGGKQLPFRYYSTHKVLTEAPLKVRAAVEECMERSLNNLPKFEGRTMSLCDNSGSAHGHTTSAMGTMKISSIANLTAVVTGLISDEGHVGVFGDNLKTFKTSKGKSIFNQVETADAIGHGIGQSTETGIWLFWDEAIREKQHWDHVFVYSDMQAGHGELYTDMNNTPPTKYRWDHGHRGNYVDVPALIKEYRRTVNPNVHVYLVQVAGYQDTIVPEFYNRTYVLGGWGDGLLKFAHQTSHGQPQQ